MGLVEEMRWVVYLLLTREVESEIEQIPEY